MFSPCSDSPRVAALYRRRPHPKSQDQKSSDSEISEGAEGMGSEIHRISLLNGEPRFPKHIVLDGQVP